MVITEFSGNRHEDLDHALSIVDADANAASPKTPIYATDTLMIDSDQSRLRAGIGHGFWGSGNPYGLEQRGAHCRRGMHRAA